MSFTPLVPYLKKKTFSNEGNMLSISKCVWLSFLGLWQFSLAGPPVEHTSSSAVMYRGLAQRLLQ
jgi:hypothetical protein